MKKISILFFVFSQFIRISAQDGDLNMTLQAHIPAPEGGSGVWHYVDKNGIEYGVFGSQNATVIYSLEDPKNPVERARINGVTTIWREVFGYGDYIYAVNDNQSNGLVIINMKGAPKNITSKFWRTDITIGGQTNTLNTCHELFVDEKGILVLAGCGGLANGGALFFDISTTPEEPKFLGYEGKRYCHDLYMRHDTMYSSDITSGLLSIWNVKDKTNPIELATVTTPYAFTHNSWISDDSKFVFTTDERNDAYVAAYDISDLKNIKLLDVYRPKDTEGKGVIPHNTRYLNGYLITSYYTDGVKITDVHRPSNIIEVGSYDTYIGPDGGFNGCWGVSPYLPSGNIVASDIQGGFFVIKPEYKRACYLEGLVQDSITGDPISGASVVIKTPRKNADVSNLIGEYKTGYADPGTFDVDVVHPEYLPTTLSATLERGVVTVKNIKLLPKASITAKITVRDFATNDLIADAPLVFYNPTKKKLSQKTNANGIAAVRIVVDSSTYQLVVGKWGYKHTVVPYDLLNPVLNLTVYLKKGYQDDFILDQGWTVESTAATGIWVKAEPIGTTSRNQPAQAENDVPGDIGDECYVTGNNGTDPSIDDVDDGYTVLASPLFDVSTYNDPVVSYYRWFTNTGGSSNPNDNFNFYINDGIKNITIEQINGTSQNHWTRSEFHIKDFADTKIPLKFIASIADDNPGHLVEGALDSFAIYDAKPTATNDPGSNIEFKINQTLFQNSTIANYSCPQTAESFIEVSAVDGNLLEKIKLHKNSGIIELGKNWKSGIYIVRLVTENNSSKPIKLVKI